MIKRLKTWAKTVRRDTIMLCLAARDPRVPLHAKAVAALVAAYALSPIDLIPDFIPFLGYLDDLVIVPLGVLLAVRLIPSPIADELRTRATELSERPVSRRGAAAIIAVWLIIALAIAFIVLR